MNIKFLHGRLTRDPEFTPRKDSESSDRVKFCIATDRRFGDKADFHDCIVFGKRAAVVDKYLRKGSEIVCWGEEQHEPYTDRNGVKRKSVTVVVDNFEFCGSKSSSGSGDSFEQAEEDSPF